MFVCMCLLVCLLFPKMFRLSGKKIWFISQVCLLFAFYAFVCGAILCLFVCVFASFFPLLCL